MQQLCGKCGAPRTFFKDNQQNILTFLSLSLNTSSLTLALMKTTLYSAILTATLLIACSRSKSPAPEETQKFFKFPFSTLSIYTGETKNLELTEQSTNYNRSEIKFISADEKIAVVDGSDIKALTRGEVIIKALRGSIELGKFNLTVTDAQITAITFPNATFSINVNQTYNIQPLLTPVFAVDKSIVWASSDPAVASVNNSGFIKGLKTGFTNITATTKNGLTVRCILTVL
jgi:uncharacterized protein YjdB